MGKSELATSFLNWAALEPSQSDIVRGRAFEMGGHLPYQPLLDGIRTRLNAENAPEDLLDDVWLAELSQLLPELRGRYPDLPQPMAGSPDFVRARLFEAMATLGIALGGKTAVSLLHRRFAMGGCGVARYAALSHQRIYGRSSANALRHYRAPRRVTHPTRSARLGTASGATRCLAANQFRPTI